MKGIYLVSFKAYHSNYNILYQDINGKRDIGGDMLDVDLSSYDFIIATPPCNYYSRANYRRDISIYSLKTKHLLPSIILKLSNCNVPCIIENVRNPLLMDKMGCFDTSLYSFIIGRYTYWSNIIFDYSNIIQNNSNDITHLSKNNRQGGDEVHEVIECFLKAVHSNKYCFVKQYTIFDFLEV